jgi:hypothetical protein
MIEHIVRMNEKVDSILNTYQITLDELKENNLHITDFSKLVCGMKLMIPFLSKNVEQILESTEGFVQKYYPKISEVISETKESIAETKEEIISENKESIVEIKEEIVSEIKEGINMPREVKELNEKKKYIGTIPPKKPYKGNIKLK